MPVNLKKENVKEQKEEVIRFCEYCRWHAVAWMGFCCAMLGVIVPFIFVRVSHTSEEFGNIFLLLTSLGGLITFFIRRPIEIKKADQQFKDMNYHSHIHLP